MTGTQIYEVARISDLLELLSAMKEDVKSAYELLDYSVGLECDVVELPPENGWRRQAPGPGRTLTCSVRIIPGIGDVKFARAIENIQSREAPSQPKHESVMTEDGRIGWPSVVEYETEERPDFIDSLAITDQCITKRSPVPPANGVSFKVIIHDRATYDYNNALGVFHDPRHQGPVRGIAKESVHV